MSRFHVAAFAFVFSLCWTVSAKASPLSPCIRATLSANGNALVVNDLTFDDPDETHVRRIEASTFRVFRSYGPNGIRVKGPDKYFADPFWQVVLTRGGKPPMIACPFAFVTDDAQYLVLVGTEFAGIDVIPAALSIYRRDNGLRAPGSVGPNGGVLVRRVPMSDFSPEIKSPEVINEATKEWFAGGAFSFSVDERTLIFTMSDGKRLQISLLTGEVQR